ncbi:hypothetical protein BpHYR1_049729 [Brachionus plicatilis]|uniref:FLYWCH-type domain-containing protein n=1 Tax=Brachionus plicatilis TaxID=10195 RepID=A0A3M7SB21_BRAPC|nr:hypothetical protein BpHYR1_049729 [Brachionus plicatilis]
MIHELNNYFFRILTTNDGNVFWRCTVTCCNVRCTTFGDKIGQKYAVNISDELVHCHEPDTSKFANLEKRRLLKEKASVSDEPAGKIISQYVSELKTPEEIVNSPSKDADRQAINRVKKKTQPSYPPEPETLSLINITNELEYTKFMLKLMNFILISKKIMLVILKQLKLVVLEELSIRLFIQAYIPTRKIDVFEYVYVYSTSPIVQSVFWVRIESVYIGYKIQTGQGLSSLNAFFS